MNKQAIERDTASTAPDIDAMLRAMANPWRLLVLDHLANREQCLIEVRRHVPLSQSLLSQHMKILCEAGLVSRRRDGQKIYHSLSPSGRRAIAAVTLLSGALE